MRQVSQQNRIRRPNQILGRVLSILRTLRADHRRRLNDRCVGAIVADGIQYDVVLRPIFSCHRSVPRLIPVDDHRFTVPVGDDIAIGFNRCRLTGNVNVDAILGRVGSLAIALRLSVRSTVACAAIASCPAPKADSMSGLGRSRTPHHSGGRLAGCGGTMASRVYRCQHRAGVAD